MSSNSPVQCLPTPSSLVRGDLHRLRCLVTYVRVVTRYGKQDTCVLQGNNYLHKKGLTPETIHAVIVATLRKNITSYATIEKDGSRI